LADLKGKKGYSKLGGVLFNNAIFYVMSGTGNTYRMACWADAENETTPSKDTLVGVLFPAHGFMPPWSMIKFLLRMRRQNGVPALCAATRGGIKVGPLRIPGAAGLGTFLAAFLMMIKGYRPRALFSLDMPSNFINFHWGLHSKNVEAMHHERAPRLFYAQQPVGGIVEHRHLMAVPDFPHRLSPNRQTLYGKGHVFQ
jgi:hypothetical protein